MPVTSPSTLTASLLPREARIHLLSDTPGKVYSAPLWMLRGDDRLIDAYLTSGLMWLWQSSFSMETANSSLLQSRSLTALHAQTASLLRQDLLQDDFENQKGCRYTLFGMDPAHAIEPKDIPSSLQNFLRGAQGLQLVVHQCNDSDEYIFVAQQPISPTLRFLDTLELPARAVTVAEPLWLKKTRRHGTLPA